MKKLIVALIAFSLVFGAVSFAAENENEVEREKISSPAEIKNFSDIIKRGKDLFGVRVRQLEKISGPWEIGNFDGIRRIGNSLWGMRKNVAKREPVLIRPEAADCVAAAIDKKDASLKAGNTAYAEAANAAIDARNTCQKESLNQTTAQAQYRANQACLETYKKSVRENHMAMKRTKEGAWKTYREDMKACGELQRQNGSTEIMIEDAEDSAAE